MVQGRKGIRPAAGSVWTRVDVKKARYGRGLRRQDEAAGDTKSNSWSRIIFACRSVRQVGFAHCRAEEEWRGNERGNAGEEYRTSKRR